MDLNKLRQQCNILIARKGYSKKGGQAILAKRISVNKNSLSMALSGFRETSGSEQILKSLKQHLTKQSEANK